MSADFTPDKENVSSIGAFRFWCQKVLPVVYDDSLSYYELLCKVVKILNTVIENTDKLSEGYTSLYNAFEALQGYVNDYFRNLDISSEIDRKIDQMVEEGFFETLVQNFAIPISEKGAVNGVATLNGEGKLVQMPTAEDIGAGIVNPDILDNSYFANPVDQRAGYIVPPATPYYDRDSLVGHTTAYTKVDYFDVVDGVAYPYITVNGTSYVAERSAPVRGYVSGYGLDRWLTQGTAILNSNYLTIKQNGTQRQRIENFRFVEGETYTLSYLTEEGVLRTASGVVDNVTASWQIGKWQDGYFFGLEYSVGESFHTVQFVANKGDLNIIAAKLEVGTKQTLARKVNGVWVLNAVPKYRKTLADCQRYFYSVQHSHYAGVTFSAGTNGQVTVPVPVTMRATPTLRVVAVGTVRTASENKTPTSLTAVVSGSNCVIVGYTVDSAFTAKNSLAMLVDAKFTLSADL